VRCGGYGLSTFGAINQGHTHSIAPLSPIASKKVVPTITRSAADKFPKDPRFTFNLACYSARVGRLDEGRHWLA
jgi:hypothetical protein